MVGIESNIQSLAHLVGGDLGARPPVPHVDDHVVLRAHAHHVLVVGREGLKDIWTNQVSAKVILKHL